ncbi:MAG: class I SAM-dependent methyltransferase [Candidatus Obscuribacterales bacterium]|nr:class I SAM-dependent methyltransferase [Candidatus Obscuribacterales bacterium]
MSKTALRPTLERSSSGQGAPGTLQDKTQRYPYETIADNEREHFWFIARNERISRLMKSEVPNWRKASFLEIGAGTGNVLGHLWDEGFTDLSGWEIVEDGIAICQKRYPNIKFSNTNFLTQKRLDQKFDSVGMFDCLEHFSDDQLPLMRVRQLLKPGGKIVLTVPAHMFLWTVMDEIFGHYRRYNKSELTRSLEEAGFTDIKSVYFMAPLVPIAIVHRGKLRVPKDATEEQIEAIMRRETSIPLRPINTAMLAISRLEHSIMGMRDLSFGGSLLAVATSPD